jgi:glycyl-tRNA synthetase beta chain
MRWPASPLRWVRPLTSVICVYDGEVLPLALDGVPVGRTTRGHRFLSPGEIRVGGGAEYVEKLQHAHVIVDQDQRHELIRADLDRRTSELGIKVKPDPGLLDEVTGLAEFPVVLAGAIDAEFMSLPPEVLQTAMRVHQKYFSCTYLDGRPAPHFLFVANNLADDGGKTIVAGNERVLRARLADACFFWDQDRKIRLEDRVDALKDRVYHAKLGSVYDKVQRMLELTKFLVPLLPGASEIYSLRAALLSKADLSTGMVGEFPELQGIMGSYYARGDGEDRGVAAAIADHYKPLGPHDSCPASRDTEVIALVDKIDTLVTFFAIGEKPTGSRDPFALRRSAQGVIRLVLEHQIQNLHEERLRLPLREVFGMAFRLLEEQLKLLIGVMSELEDPTEELLGFIVDRLKAHLREHNFRHDHIAAAAFVWFRGEVVPDDDISRITDRAYYLRKFLDTDDGSNLLTAFRRASNIVVIEERREGRRYDDPVDWTLFRVAEEQALYQRLSALEITLTTFMATERFDQTMARLATLRQPVDEFFNKVTVNTDDVRLRENRLRLLARIRATMNQVADFSLIEG